jgi:hypothetical protein
MRIPCTCGCGLQVTYATKINHLNGRGKTLLRARVLEENEILGTITEKRPHPSSNQGNRYRKRLKVAQLEIDQIPTSSLQNDEFEIFPDCSPILQADKELLPSGELSSVRQSGRIAERTRHMAERRWGNSHLQDRSLGSDCGNGHWSEDEENDNDHGIVGEKDGDDEEDGDDDDEDGDDEDNDESDVTGISAWDLLGDGFEREAASIGMFLAHE